VGGTVNQQATFLILLLFPTFVKCFKAIFAAKNRQFGRMLSKKVYFFKIVFKKINCKIKKNKNVACWFTVPPTPQSSNSGVQGTLTCNI
jgi:hypothetical protein